MTRIIVLNGDEKLVYCNACGQPKPEQNVFYGKTLAICDQCIQNPSVEQDLINDGDPNE